MYKDRADAGRQLAEQLGNAVDKSAVVIGLPRGGMVLAAEVADVLSLPLDMVLVRKIGHPAYAEYAIGAVAEDGEPILNQSELVGLDEAWLKESVDAARQLIQKRHQVYYNDDIRPLDVKNRPVIIVDDGMATGFTMAAAIESMRAKQARHITVAVPVASLDSIDMVSTTADRIIVLKNPKDFSGSVGAHYQEFDQVGDEQVRELLMTHLPS